MDRTAAPPPRLALTVSEFCNCCAIGRSLFYEEVKSGRIRVLKVGKRTLVPTTEAQRWLESLGT